tara:strand:+ start:73 stop:459 length:387 start_codon:yes stop_codon:yes gene_type:complete
MSVSGSEIDVSFEATATLATSQYLAVKLDASNPFKVVIADANAKVVGILQNKPAAGETAIVRVAGVSKHVMGEASMTPGDLVTATSAGKGEQVDAAGEFSYGMLLSNADADDVASILVYQSIAHASDA